MEKTGIGKKNIAALISCTVLLVVSFLIYSGIYKTLQPGRETVLSVGVFSDSYWNVQNGYSHRILNDAIRRFEEEHPGVRVEYVSGIRKEDYSEWLSEQMLTDNTPDMFFVLPEDFNKLVDLGALKALTELAQGDDAFDETAFYSSAFLYGQFDGQQYALPYECAPKLMFVNKTILDGEGLEIPDETWSWEDFYRICEEVTKDTDGDGITDQFGVVGYTWQDAFESNGVELFAPDGKSCRLNGPNVEEALTFIENLSGLLGGYNVTSREFDLGNVAFQPMSFSEYRAYKSYPLSIKKYAGFEWDCIPMPAGPHGGNISSLDTLLAAIGDDTKHAALAWDFLKLLTYDEQVQSEIFDYSEGVSVLREVTGSDRVLQKLMEDAGNNGLNQTTLCNAVEQAVVVPRFRHYSDAVAEVDRAVNEIIAGEANIGTELIIWNREINRKLNNNA